MGKTLDASIEFQLLALIVFNDKACIKIKDGLPPEKFITEHRRTIAKAAYTHIEKYKRAPRQHIQNLDPLDRHFKFRVEEDDRSRGASETKLIQADYDRMLEEHAQIDAEFVLDRLDEFIEHRSMSDSLVKIEQHLQHGDVAAAREVYLDEKAKAKAARQQLVTRSAADIEPRAIEWLWPQRIPLGKLTIIAGNPGIGKGFLFCDIAARVTRDSYFPDTPGDGLGRRILILSTEDDADDTIIVRLAAARANLNRVRIIYGVGKKDAPTPWTLDCIGQLEAFLESEAEAKRYYAAIIFDPLAGFFGKETDSHKDKDVRVALAPLIYLLQRWGIAGIGIAHLNKRLEGNAVQRFLASIGIVAAARAAFLVAPHKEDSSLIVFAPVKANLSKRVDALAYQLIDAEVVTPTGKTLNVARVRWSQEPVDVTADQLLRDKPGRGPDKRIDAIVFLTEFLKGGAKLHAEILEAAKAQGISPPTLRRAKESLGIKSSKVRGDPTGPWQWALPNNADKGSRVN